MSLILDALSRSERERRARETGVPDLLLAPPITGARRAPARFRVLAALLLVLAGAGAWWLWPAPHSDGNPGVAQSVSPLPADDPVPGPLAPAPPPAPAPSAGEDPVAVTRAPKRIADPGTDAAVRALYARPGSATAPAAEASPNPKTPAAAQSPAPAGNAAEIPVKAADDPNESAVDIEQVLQAARRTLADSALAPHATPLLGDLSPQFRDRVPTLMYLRHDFASDGSAAVVINGESLRAGQRVNGVTVREVLPDSVILGFDDQEFRLRALNSWINL